MNLSYSNVEQLCNVWLDIM